MTCCTTNRLGRVCCCRTRSSRSIYCQNISSTQILPRSSGSSTSTTSTKSAKATKMASHNTGRAPGSLSIRSSAPTARTTWTTFGERPRLRGGNRRPMTSSPGLNRSSKRSPPNSNTPAKNSRRCKKKLQIPPACLRTRSAGCERWLPGILRPSTSSSPGTFRP